MTTAIVPGSLRAIAQAEGRSLAESFLSADAIVLIDVSGSMGIRDVENTGGPSRPYFGEPTRASGRTRFEAACDELARLQKTLPGQIAVVQFSSSVGFCWGGRPLYEGQGTALHAALNFVRPADGTVEFFVISDGHPDDPDAALAVARKFDSVIHTIYIGPEGGPGAAFLRRLASVAGGQSSANKVPELAARIGGLLTSGKAA